jgi:hypothetical protein
VNAINQGNMGGRETLGGSTDLVHRVVLTESSHDFRLQPSELMWAAIAERLVRSLGLVAVNSLASRSSGFDEVVEIVLRDTFPSGCGKTARRRRFARARRE